MPFIGRAEYGLRDKGWTVEEICNMEEKERSKFAEHVDKLMQISGVPDIYNDITFDVLENAQAEMKDYIKQAPEVIHDIIFAPKHLLFTGKNAHLPAIATLREAKKYGYYCRYIDADTLGSMEFEYENSMSKLDEDSPYYWHLHCDLLVVKGFDKLMRGNRKVNHVNNFLMKRYEEGRSMILCSARPRDRLLYLLGDDVFPEMYLSDDEEFLLYSAEKIERKK